ncbi:MAG: glycosyl hydrolase family 31, partial [Alistipes sp.]|nr:glycosyl hydrolase family 31 [Alistipes sp.]
PADCVRGYRELTGAASLPPKWGFGFWQSKERYKSFDELECVVREYRRRGIPLDVIVQDWEYWGDRPHWNSLGWDSVRFADPAGRIARLHREYGVRLMLSVWPGFGPKTAVYEDLERAGALFDERTWAGYKVFDAFDPAARDIFWSHFSRGLLASGVDGWWMDATEPSFREGFTQRRQEARTKSAGRTAWGAFHRYLNVYSLVWTGDLYARLRAAQPERRPFLFTRSAFAGQQRYGTAVWSGDVVASWPNFRRQLAAGVGLSAAGFPWWTVDAGGFFVKSNGGLYPRGLSDSDYRCLYARWFQFAALLPIFRAHGTDVPREVWQFGGEGSTDYRNQLKFIHLRYRLMPFIYSAARGVAAEGASMIEALGMAFPEDRAVARADDAYLLGGALLVRPVFEPLPVGAVRQHVATLLPQHAGT